MASHPILIVGGGLTTALALARRGRPTRVLEGAAEFGAIGYGIQFGPNVFHVIDLLGLTANVLAVAEAPGGGGDAGCARWQRIGAHANRRVVPGAFQNPYIIVHRIDLHNVLLDAGHQNEMIELVADAMVTGFEEDGDKVGVATADGRTFSGARAGAALAQGPGRSSGRRPARAVATLAQGACMAIEDGFFLAETIAAAGDDFAAAFRRFETIRLTCTARVQLESRSMWNSFLHVEGIERDVRNTTVARWDGAHLFDQHRQSRSIALQNNLRLHEPMVFMNPRRLLCGTRQSRRVQRKSRHCAVQEQVAACRCVGLHAHR